MIREAQDKADSPETLFSSPSLSDSFSPSIVIIEARALIKDCLALCLQKKLGMPVLTYSDASAWSQDPAGSSACVIILSGAGGEADQSGLIRELSHWEKEVPVVIFSDNESKSEVANNLRAGARGYILSNTPLEVVAKAIKLVLVGGVFVPANVVLESSPEPAPHSGKLEFTARESDVVKALLKGKSNKVIAFELKLSESSVKVHVRNIMRKLQVRNRTEAVIKIAQIARAPEDQTGDRALPYCS